MKELENEEIGQIAGGTYRELREGQELLDRIREFGRMSTPTLIDCPITF